MESQITTLEQTEKLLFLGLSSDLCSCEYFRNKKECGDWQVQIKHKRHNQYVDVIPAFTLSDLMMRLPSNIKYKRTFGYLKIERYKSDESWTIWYGGFVHFDAKRLIDVVFLAVEWLLSNGYTLKQ